MAFIVKPRWKVFILIWPNHFLCISCKCENFGYRKLPRIWLVKLSQYSSDRLEKNFIPSSDSSDNLSQQLEIGYGYNPHAPSIFPSLSLPFFIHYSIPFFLPHTTQFGSQRVQPTYYLTGCVLHFSISTSKGFSTLFMSE